jgi:hypothetical protein
VAKPLPTSVLQAQLDPGLQTAIVTCGFRPAAVRGHVEIPARGQSPAREGDALVCRLYPDSQETRIAFAAEHQVCAEAVVFEDPDDVLAWNLKAGFENALLVASELMNHHRRGKTNHQ